MRFVRATYLALLAAALVLLAPSIISHTVWLMGGKGLRYILQGRWDIAAINIAFFTGFLFLTAVKRRVNWRSRNIYAAFIVALFAEMYGFPLTAYFFANYFGTVQVDYRPQYFMHIQFLDVMFTLPTMMIVGGAVTVVGLILISVGWYQVYRGGGKLVKDGLYRYSRHPQYVGILMVTFGWILHWPTLLTVAMWPFLLVIYYRLAREEEAWVRKQNPGEFDAYMRQTPMFI